MRLGSFSSSTRQTFYLWIVDGASNALDYVFHLLVGRTLLPAGFAVVQTINSGLLIFVTAVAVFQPVVARFIANLDSAPRSAGLSPAAVGIFRQTVTQAFWIGLILSSAAFLGAGILGSWLNLPRIVVQIAAPLLLLALLKPVVAGVLQGSERFQAYGLLRLTQAAGRLSLGALFLWAGSGALGAVSALPLGYLAGLLAGVLLLGRQVWRRPQSIPHGSNFPAGSLAVSSLIAFASFMSMVNTDLIWINRGFEPSLVGEYAATVLLRRVLLLVPGAAVVVMFPRVVSEVSRGRIPDRTIGRTLALSVLPTVALTLLYFRFGEQLISWTFGASYIEAARYLGWMGLSVVGYTMVTVWMNVFLATRPAPFIALMGISALAQNILYARYGQTVSDIIRIFGLTGWLLVAAGGLLYVLWLRPGLQEKQG